MKRLALVLLLVLIAFAAGLWTALRRPRAALPDPPAVVTRIKEVARLETLELQLYKKVTFAPEPQPTSSVVGDVFEWAKFTLKPPAGRAIVFATVRLGIDLEQLDVASLSVAGERARVILPPLRPVVELRPGETEVIGSNLDSAQTAQLLELAKAAFEREVMADARVRERAEQATQRAIRGVLFELGFKEVTFGPVPPG